MKSFQIKKRPFCTTVRMGMYICVTTAEQKSKEFKLNSENTKNTVGIHGINHGN